ncbi:MAG: hypothetical protein SangKO_048200 [Sandaracinaceae bacterium]
MTGHRSPGEDARRHALAGNASGAIAEFERLAATGDVSASASLSELAAFRDDWETVLAHAGRVVTDPDRVYAGNVFDDMVRLLALAGEEGLPWSAIASATKTALRANTAQVHAHLRTRREKWLRALLELASGDGQGLEEWPVWTWGSRTPAPNPAAFEAAVARLGVANGGTSKAAARHVFHLAVTFGVSRAVIEQYESCPESMDFSCGLEVARRLAFDRPSCAWAAIQRHLPTWQPVDRAQVAPVVLLVDPRLRHLCTPERARTVLETPRGSVIRNRG